MFKISEHIYNELKDSEVKTKKMEVREKNEILDLVLRKYIDFSKKSCWLWERFIKYEALNEDMAWSYIKDFVQEKECIMFFNQDEEKDMIIFQSGEDLNYALSETYGFEFYVTDRTCSYLICFNHHNILYGCGNAEKWVKEIKQQQF